MITKEQILIRLAECRLNYPLAETQKERDLLLENTMLAIQDLLYLEKINWR